MTNVLRMTEEQFRVLGNKHRKPRTAATPHPETKEYADEWPIVLRDQIVAAGLPEPYREFTFHDSRNFRLDLAWPLQKRAIECDGAVHAIKRMVARDIVKHNLLTLAGYRWLRVTPEMVRDGEALELVRALLDG